MFTVRRSKDRGHFDFGWLKTYHTFSFADYHDPEHMNFRSLRVINEDWIEPEKGFGLHGHKDMEIISYVVEGALTHKDSMGNGSEIPAGEFQYMSAGSGVVHSEFNHSKAAPTHLLQIWIVPEENGLTPRYSECRVPKEDKVEKFALIASKDGEGAPISIRQNIKLFVSILPPKRTLKYILSPKRHAWIQLIHGTMNVGGETLNAGDGAAASDETALVFESGPDEAEFLLFDLL